MNKLQWTLLLSCISLFSAGASTAQMNMGPQMPRGIFNPVVGSGAVYNLHTERGMDMTVEIDVVGKESDGYWVETSMTGMPGPMGDMVMKTLTVLDGPNVSQSRVIMQMGNRPPMEMPAQFSQRNQIKQPSDIRTVADDLGSESVTVPAGTYTCEHYRLKDGSGEAWVSEKVTPYGAVKFKSEKTTMELAKLVTDAKDKITGTPQSFNPQALMGQRPPQ